ncbi:hypothetical protein TWF173_007060 [Orbilia oligospora]|nr:hypothetical protein TWF173_007060 [Orbilia oligospora]
MTAGQAVRMILDLEAPMNTAAVVLTSVMVRKRFLTTQRTLTPPAPAPIMTERPNTREWLTWNDPNEEASLELWGSSTGDSEDLKLRKIRDIAQTQLARVDYDKY